MYALQKQDEDSMYVDFDKWNLINDEHHKTCIAKGMRQLRRSNALRYSNRSFNYIKEMHAKIPYASDDSALALTLHRKYTHVMQAMIALDKHDRELTQFVTLIGQGEYGNIADAVAQIQTLTRRMRAYLRSHRVTSITSTEIYAHTYRDHIEKTYSQVYQVHFHFLVADLEYSETRQVFKGLVLDPLVKTPLVVEPVDKAQPIKRLINYMCKSTKVLNTKTFRRPENGRVVTRTYPRSANNSELVVETAALLEYNVRDCDMLMFSGDLAFDRKRDVVRIGKNPSRPCFATAQTVDVFYLAPRWESDVTPFKLRQNDRLRLLRSIYKTASKAKAPRDYSNPPPLRPTVITSPSGDIVSVQGAILVSGPTATPPTKPELVREPTTAAALVAILVQHTASKQPSKPWHKQRAAVTVWLPTSQFAPAACGPQPYRLAPGFNLYHAPDLTQALIV